MKRNQVLLVSLATAFLALAPFAPAQDVRITEFMTSNTKTLQDEDHDYSDWIEIYNNGVTNVNLLDWSLTDNAGNLSKWQFPGTNIGPSQLMIVFASGKNRRVPGAPLHTSFKLSSAGGYLALVRPDNSIATEYNPYPPQLSDVSYGVGLTQTVSIVMATNVSVRALVPSSGSLGTSWMFPGFNDSGWQSGTSGVGYDAGALNPGEDLASSVILTSAPIDYWRFSETSGTAAANEVPSGAIGIYNNVTLNTAGPRPVTYAGFETTNTAAQFNGTNSYISSGSTLLSGLPAFSMAGWIRPTSTQLPRSGLFGQNDAIEFGFLTASTIQVLTTGGGSLTVNYAFPLGEWHHIAVVGDGTTLKIYYDGVQAGSGGTATANYGSSAFSFNIGGGGIFDGSTNFFNGQIDEVGVWNRALTAGEVLQQFQAAQAPAATVSYANLIGTDLTASMFGVNSSAYIRFPFTVADPSHFERLRLRIQYDDGFAAYINGSLVAFRNASPAVMNNPLDYNAAATTYHPDGAAIQFEDIDITTHLGALTPGANVLAIQGLNTSATNSDFLIRPELDGVDIAQVSTNSGYFKLPTPGALNGVTSSDIGPIISQVGNIPALPIQPRTTDSITVTARVTRAFNNVTNVYLTWRVMFGGTNQLPMFDDGLHGDGAAGDGIYGATIPSGVATNGEMLRWIIWANDAGGHLSRWPLYELTDGSAEWEGTVFYDPNLSSKLPIVQVFINPNSTNWIKAFPSGVPSMGVDSESGGRISLYSDGEFYDNVYMELRGNTTAGYPKNSHHLNFNAEKLFKHPGPGGRIRHTTFLSEQADPAYLRTYLSFWLLDQMGVPSPFDYPMRFQLNTLFYGLYFHNDTLNAEQLDRLGYDPGGALYKAAGQIRTSHDSTGGFEKKTRLYEGTQDFDAMATAISETKPAGTRKTNIFDIFNIPEIVNYLAVARWNQEGDDVWANMSVYRDSNNTKEWSIVPFDLNVSWGQLYCGDASTTFNSVIATNDQAKSHPLYGGSAVLPTIGGANWNRIYDVIISTPETRQMLLRRQRTLLDKIILPPGTAFGQSPLEQQIMTVTNQMWTEMFMDRTNALGAANRWGFPCAGVCGMYCWGSPMPTNESFGIPGIINQYINPRRVHWFATHCITNTGKTIGVGNAFNAGIPLPQPGNAFINIVGLEANPSSGNQAEEYICITNPIPFALDISGWKLSGAIDFTFKPGTVMPSNSVIYVARDLAAFRSRASGPSGGQALFVVGPFNGQLSARGETINVSDDFGRPLSTYTYPDASSAAQQFLRITEIMYHPAPLLGNPNGPEEFEYVEFKNISPTVTLDLTGVRFTNGIDFNFTGSAVTTLAPGARVLIVKNLAVFTARYGSLANIAGQYGGYLDNGGERIQLLDAAGEEILDFSYNNSWYPITDGLGFSLVVVNELADPDAWDSKTNWRPSGQLNGSPGVVDPAPPVIVPVVINEALTRTDTPPPTDTIELYNPTGTPADISGWYLTDDFGTNKYRIPNGTIIQPGTYRTFNESDFNPNPGVFPSFALSGDGDEVYIFSANSSSNLTGYYHGFTFGAAENGVSFGRYITSEGKEHFVAQVGLTLGTNNAGPRVGPVVINEIMYHPPEIQGADNTDDEYIELLNITGSPVPLFNGPSGSPWKVSGGIDFTFPTNVTLAAGQSLLLVNFNPTNAAMLAAFRAKYGVGAGVPVFGPYGGKLNNDGDNIELKKATTILNGKIPYVLVDKVEFQDSAPWPTGADGFGLSLQRKVAGAYGNEPTNWVAAAPSAGAANAAVGVPPSITSQSGSQTGIGTTSLTLGVTATGDNPLQYQWRFNGTNIVGATNANLQLNNLQVQNGGDYRVVVFNHAGSTVSSNMNIRVVIAAIFQAQPQSQTLFPSNTASFSVIAYSPYGALRYQWRFNGVDISGATNASYSITNIQPVHDGQYRVAVTDPLGTVTSDIAQLTVLTHPVFTLQPASQTVKIVGPPVNATFTAAATSTTPISYQWRFGNMDIPGATNPSLTITNLQAANAGVYTVVATDSYGSFSSAPATLLLLFSPVITQQPQSKMVAFGGTASFTVTATGTLPMTNTWRRGLPIILTIVTNNNTSFYATNNVTTGGVYRVGIANIAGSSSGLSSTALLYVVMAPTNVQVNLGDSASFKVSPVDPGLFTYQWQFNGTNINNATSNTLALANVQNSDQGPYSVIVTVTTNVFVPPTAFTAGLFIGPPTQPSLLNSQLFPDGSFHGVLQGQAYRNYSIDVSSNLINWAGLIPLTATNTLNPFTDPTATNAPQRFYRARVVP